MCPPKKKDKGLASQKEKTCIYSNKSEIQRDRKHPLRFQEVSTNASKKKGETGSASKTKKKENAYEENIEKKQRLMRKGKGR